MRMLGSGVNEAIERAETLRSSLTANEEDTLDRGRRYKMLDAIKDLVNHSNKTGVLGGDNSRAEIGLNMAEGILKREFGAQKNFKDSHRG